MKNETDLNTETISITYLRINWGKVFDEVSENKKRFIITRHGKPLAVLMPAESHNLLQTQKEKE